MKKRAFVCVPAVALALLLVGCGGGAPTGIVSPNPASPPTPSSGSIRFVIASGDELIGLPVPPITGTVTIASVTKPFAGDVAFDGVRLGDPVRIDAGASFIVRTTLVRSMGEQRVYLRPASDDAFFRQISYGELNNGRQLLRPERDMVVVLSPELQTSEIINAHEEAITELNEALNGSIRLSLSLGSPPHTIVCLVKLNPELSPSYGGWTSLTTRNASITGAEIQYRRIEGASSRLIKHELGHALGLAHVDVTSSLMSPQLPYELTTSDVLALRLHFQRPPGNELPDDDTMVKGTSVRGKQTFSCGW